MYSETGGFCNFNDDDAEAARKKGWVDGEPIRQKLLDAKRAPKAPIAKPVETVTITPQSEVKRSPGRPRNVVHSILNNGEV
jgi:hypothetical protein